MFIMNDLPVIGYPCLRNELWDRQGGKHCKSLEGNVWRKVVSTSKKTILGKDSKQINYNMVIYLTSEYLIWTKRKGHTVHLKLRQRSILTQKGKNIFCKLTVLQSTDR